MKRDYQIFCKIITLQSRLESGLITNSKTIKYTKRDIKGLKKELKELNKDLYNDISNINIV